MGVGSRGVGPAEMALALSEGNFLDIEYDRAELKGTNYPDSPYPLN